LLRELKNQKVVAAKTANTTTFQFSPILNVKIFLFAILAGNI
jgi:hypothetical protein